MSTRPNWITAAGSLGTIPEGEFYRVPVQATSDAPVKYRVIAGNLPIGMQVTLDGFVEGIPRNAVLIRGEPQDVGTDITASFAIRAYTELLVNGVTTVDRLADRTFELTVVSQAVPEFTTPPGRIGTFYDGNAVDLQLEFTDGNLDDQVRCSIVSGSLPPGVSISRTGLISGVIQPFSRLVTGLTLPPGLVPGYDNTPKDEYPNDFNVRASSRNYQFAVEITDGKDSNVRTFEIYVYAKDSMTADTIDFTADNTFITADVVGTRTPVITTPEGSIGRVRSDNYFAFRFDAVDFDGDDIVFAVTTGSGLGFDETLFDETGIGFDRAALSLPPGLTFDVDTGWLSGYIPDLGATELDYRFAVRVQKRQPPAPNWTSSQAWVFADIVTFSGRQYTALQDVPIGISLDNALYWQLVPDITSGFYYFTLTIAGDTDTDIIWLTDSDLGTITNGAISTYSIEAFNIGARSLLFRLVSGSRSRLPQGLTLLPSGNIVGRVSFNTFAVDQGTTTFDRSTRKVYDYSETTFDSQFSFEVNAYCPQTEQLGYQVERIDIINGGTGYTEQPQIVIAPPPLSENSIRATAGVVTTDSNGRITGIAVGNPGRGYLTPPTITISGGGGSGAVAVAVIAIVDLVNAVSVRRRFTVRVLRVYNEPYESLYIKAMPSRDNRNLLNSLLFNQSLLPVNSIYRYDDPNFGVARAVKYVHAYGLTASTIDQYVQSMELNHYWKNLVLGPVRTAQALGSDGQQVYEVIYCDIIDDLVNNQGQSVSQSVTLPFPVDTEDSTGVDEVYPNSLINMRDRVISAIGQEETILPLWMTSRQANGEVLGFRPVWVIAYVKPGEAERLAYLIRTQFGDLFNRIDYRVDRYELDRSQTWLWNSELKQWGDGPPQATTFDSFAQYLYFAVILDTNGTIESTELYQGDGHQTNFGFVPLFDAGQIVVTIDGVTQPYLEPRTEDISTAYRIFYQFTLPFYNIQTWDITEFYTAETVVTTNDRYYRARFDVPPGNAITNEFYWREIPAPNQIEFQNPPPNNTVVGIYQLKNKWVLDPNSAARRSTTFDGGSTTFVNLSDQFTGGDERDKYLVFPRVNILG